MNKQIVILGAGFGGLAAAKALGQKRQYVYGYDVTVIDRQPQHVFTPLLYEVATGFFDHENLGSPKLLRSGVVMDTAEMLKRWKAAFVCDEIVGVDWDGKRVLVKDGEAVPFDTLIIALGAEVNFFGIEGMREHAYTLKSVRDADRLRQRLHDVLHMMEDKKTGAGNAGHRAHDPLTVVVGGAGATGVEFAAELTMFLRRHMMKGHLKPGDFHVYLVEATSRVLGMMDPQLSLWALQRLEKLGVHVYLDACVKGVKLGRVTLAPRPLRQGENPEALLCDFRKETEKGIDADIVVWTGGIRGNTSLEKLGLKLDERGQRLEVGPTLEVPGHKDVFAIGDSALLMDPSTKRPVPWLAQAAMEQGRVVATTIINRILSAPDAVYGFPEYPVAVPLGGKFAVVQSGGMKIKDWPAWCVRALADLRYFMTVLPFWQALRQWWHGVETFGQND